MITISLEDLRREPTIYLVPECQNEEESREYLEEVCGEILEEQLNGWYRVRSSWPTRPDLNTFDQWFQWSFHSMVVDRCDDPVLQEEICTAQARSLAGVGDGLKSWRNLDE